MCESQNLFCHQNLAKKRHHWLGVPSMGTARFTSPSLTAYQSTFAKKMSSAD
jgi:hypothetical protein